MAEVSAKKLNCAEENNEVWLEKSGGRSFALILQKLVEENFLNKSYLFSNLYFNRLKNTENSREFISLNLSLAAGHVTTMMTILVLKKGNTVYNSCRIFFLKSAEFFYQNWLSFLVRLAGNLNPDLATMHQAGSKQWAGPARANAHGPYTTSHRPGSYF
jgi:hypothetical protein